MDVLLAHYRNMKGVIDDMETERQAIMAAQWEFKRIDRLPDALIVFADVIEKANQYFDFKKTAKEKYNFQCSNNFYVDCREIFDTLLHDEQLKFKFNKIGEDEFKTAGNAISHELHDEKDGRVGTSQDEALEDWIFNLIFQARESDYVMDQNPIVELQKIMKSDPHVYDTYFNLFFGKLAKCTKISTEQAYNKYAQVLKDVKTYCGTKPASKKVEDVTHANVMRGNSRKNG